MKFYFLSILILLTVTICAQNDYKYRVSFSDKNQSPYSILSPQEFLSLKAIERRERQRIAISHNDIPVNPAYIDSIIKIGATVLNTSKWFNSAIIIVSDTLDLQVIYSLSFVDEIKLVGGLSSKHYERDSLSRKIRLISNMPNRKIISSPSVFKTHNILQENHSTINFDYGYAANQINMLAGNVLHRLGLRGEGVTIAVLDAGFSGVDQLHVFDSLWMNGQIIFTKDFVDNGGSVFDNSQHGMKVLSLMAANLPGLMIGTAPAANYMLLRCENAASEYVVEEDNWVAAAEFADSAGADIINSSLGYTTFNDSLQNHSYSEMNGNSTRVSIAADICAAKGIVVVNSAGNSGGNSWRYIGAPADADSILSIGAVDSNGVYASFSSIGPTSDGRVKPDVCAQGQSAVVAVSEDEFAYGNGTSLSSPIIAGLTACLWQSNLESNNMEVIDAVRRSGSLYDSPTNEIGYGIPNFLKAMLLLNNVELRNIDTDEELTVFPNPFHDILFFAFESVDTSVLSIEIYNLEGKIVFETTEINRTEGCNSFYINMPSYLRTGIYLIKISTGDIVISNKVIKK